MTSEVKDHYDKLLASQYSFVYTGGTLDFDRRAKDFSSFFESSGIVPARTPGAVAVDLGAGNGYSTIPLAEAGYSVTAVDFSSQLLAELRKTASEKGLSVKTTEADICTFALPRDAAVVVCMTDTILHLPDRGLVQKLFADVSGALRTGGKFAVSFRDLAKSEMTGNARFLPVASTRDKIFTCFLEYAGDRVRVHDIVNERSGDTFKQSVSSYWKLRISQADVLQMISKAGLSVKPTDVTETRGMVHVVATKP